MPYATVSLPRQSVAALPGSNEKMCNNVTNMCKHYVISQDMMEIKLER